eukprot:SAG22_NODE_318_length_12494_cov_18.507705_8_plen_1145_part_00
MIMPAGKQLCRLCRLLHGFSLSQVDQVHCPSDSVSTGCNCGGLTCAAGRNAMRLPAAAGKLLPALLLLLAVAGPCGSHTPVVHEVAVDAVSGFTTVRLALRMSFKASVYAVSGDAANEMIIPPAYQAAAPFGVDVGGADPAFFQFAPELQYDSWLTVAETGGDNPNSNLLGISNSVVSIGINFTHWTPDEGLRIDDGAVFWMVPTTSPIVEPGEDVVVGQLSVRTGTAFLGTLNAQGKTWCSAWPTDPAVCGDDWVHNGYTFTMAAPAGAPAGCVAGTADIDSDAATACVTCALGRYAAANATACAPCDAGWLDHDSDAATPCEACPAGRSSSAGQAECRPQHCTSGLTVAHSTTLCSGFRTGQACELACERGFVSTGEHVCGPDGSLAGGSCAPANCTDGLVLLHTAEGLAPCAGATGHVCLFSCANGYRADGEHVCLESGVFTGGRCTAVDVCEASEDDCAATAVCIPAGPGTHQCQCDNNYFGTGSECTRWTRCVPGVTYEAAAPSHDQDRVCEPVTQCAAGEWAARAATLWVDAYCASCAVGTYQPNSNAATCPVCPDGTFDSDRDPTTPCTVVNVLTTPAVHAVVSAAVSPSEFAAAVVAALGPAAAVELHHVQIQTYVQTAAGMASLPGTLADFADVSGPACTQLLAGLASATGVSSSGVSIVSVSGGRRALQASDAAAASGGVQVEYAVAAGEELEAVLAADFMAVLAVAVNAAGSAIAPVEASHFSPVDEVATAVTFVVATDEEQPANTASGSSGDAVAVDQGRLQNSVRFWAPDATVVAHPTVALSSEVPPVCAAGSALLGLACTLCPAGMADTDHHATTLCDECPAGRYAPSGSTECQSCVAGTRDVDADPATPCAPPQLVSAQVTLVGVATKAVADRGIAAAVGVDPLNVEIIEWYETITGRAVVRQAGTAELSAKQLARLETGLAGVFGVSPRSVELAAAGGSAAASSVNFTVMNGHDVAHTALTDMAVFETELAAVVTAAGEDTNDPWALRADEVGVEGVKVVTEVDFIVVAATAPQAIGVAAGLSGGGGMLHGGAAVAFGEGVVEVEGSMVAHRIVSEDTSEVRDFAAEAESDAVAQGGGGAEPAGASAAALSAPPPSPGPAGASDGVRATVVGGGAGAAAAVLLWVLGT